jgi:hypothetical protein
LKANRRIIVFVFAVILIFTICDLLFLSQLGDDGDRSKDVETNSSLVDDTDGVKITAFNWTTVWCPIAGLWMGRGFNITISNLGAEDLEGLMLTVKNMNGHSQELKTQIEFYGPGQIGYSPPESFDGILHSNETRTLRGGMGSDWGTLTSAWAIGPITTLVQISLNGTVLDEFQTIGG